MVDVSNLRQPSRAGGWEVVPGVASREDPSVVSAAGTLGEAVAAAVSNGYLYVVEPDHGLWVFDLADPAKPKPVAFKELPGDFMQLATLGNFLIYVAKGGLWMVDVSNPAAPRIESTCCPAGATWLDVQDGLGYMATTENGLHMLDMADPAHPIEIGVFPSDTWQVEVAVRESLAYVAEDAKPDRQKNNTWLGGGLRILDVSNPSQPQELSFVDTPGWVTDMALVGDLVYLAGYGQMRVLDVSDPLEPVEVQVYELPPYANRVVIVTDDKVAVPIGNDLVRFDGPESGVAPGWGVLTRAGLGVIAGNLVYVPAGDQGLLVLRLPPSVAEP